MPGVSDPGADLVSAHCSDESKGGEGRSGECRHARSERPGGRPGEGILCPAQFRSDNSRKGGERGVDLANAFILEMMKVGREGTFG